MRWRSGVVALLACALSCATVGKNFEATRLSWLKSGETTKAQVFEQLGQPFRVGSESGELTWTYGYYEYRAFGESNTKDLVLRFTPEGKVRSFTLNTSFPSEREGLDPASSKPAPAK
jgi:outer membrane protein assembly factor BamE (lipoprotein component of BamABCDE complex)